MAQECIMMETSNATSLNTNRDTALKRDAHFQAVQEACLNEAQIATMKIAANRRGKDYIGGPIDPEQGKAVAGVGALFLKGLVAYEVQNPTDDYRDAERCGRCKIVSFDVGGTTIACGIVYGWTGAKKGNDIAARTDDILAIIEVQFEAMELGPKLIMGDLNGILDVLPTAMALIKEHGWTDIGNDESKCHGKPGKATCKTRKDANESRIDFILANNRMTPPITSCRVDEHRDYPAHRPPIIEVVTKLLESTCKELKKPTNFAWMLNQKIEKEVEEAQLKREEEKARGYEDFEGEQGVHHQEKEPWLTPKEDGHSYRKKEAQTQLCCQT